MLATLLALLVACRPVVREELQSVSLVVTNGVVVDGTGADTIADGLDCLDIPDNFPQRPQLKLAALIYRAEPASIPGTIPGRPYQEGKSFAGRSDRTQFKAMAQLLCN